MDSRYHFSFPVHGNGRFSGQEKKKATAERSGEDFSIPLKKVYRKIIVDSDRLASRYPGVHFGDEVMPLTASLAKLS